MPGPQAHNPEFAPNHFIPLLPKGRLDNILYRAQIGLREAPMPLQELEAILENEAKQNGTIVFPSHFLEYLQREDCLKLLCNLALPFYVQISPGAELRDYLLTIKLIMKDRGFLFRLELVMDRAPYERDWEIIKDLQGAGMAIRYVYCPVREFNTLAVLRKLPGAVLENLYFYFPMKLSPMDSFFSEDEIFLFLQKVREELPSFPVRIMKYRDSAEMETPAKENCLKKAFRESPTNEAFAASFPKLGRGPLLRKPIAKLLNQKITEPLVAAPHFLIWLFDDPLAAIWNFIKNRYYFCRRVLDFCHRAAIVSYYSTQAALSFLFYWIYHWAFVLYYFLRAPASTLKERAPILYWCFFFPWLKLFWFSSFQFKKRILKRTDPLG